MHAYVYDAALYCGHCAGEIMEKLDRKGARDTGNSGDYPQSAPDGGGEADSPQHCDACQLFLENSLTDDGTNYMLEAVEDDLQRLLGGRIKSAFESIALTEWAPFYGVSFEAKL